MGREQMLHGSPYVEQIEKYAHSLKQLSRTFMGLEERKKAKEAKDWATSDRIRDSLNALGITIKDTRDGTEWSV